MDRWAETENISGAGKENAGVTNGFPASAGTSNRKIFSTPLAKLNRSVVIARTGRRRGVNKDAGNMSIRYKSSLKANNKNLARALDLSKRDLAAMAKKILELEQEKQEQAAKISVLRRLTDQSSDAVEEEVQRRIKPRLELLKRKLGNTANLLHMAGDELHEVIVLCEHQEVKGIDEVVKETLELTQMCTPDNFNTLKTYRHSVYLPGNVPVAASDQPDNMSFVSDEDDTNHKLSTLDEAAEMRRRSSLRHSLLPKDDLNMISMDIENKTLSTSRRGSMALRRSQVLSMNDTDNDMVMVEPERPMRRSKRVSGRLSASIFDKATNSIQPLEPVLSAAHTNFSANVQHSTPADISDNTEQEDSRPTTCVETSDDGMASEEVVFNTKALKLHEDIPFDEIPVGRHMPIEASPEQSHKPVSRSRRETMVIKHSANNANSSTTDLLDDAAEKFFVHLSPPQIFKEKAVRTTDGIQSVSVRPSRRETFVINNEQDQQVSDENDSQLEQSDTEAERTLVNEDIGDEVADAPEVATVEPCTSQKVSKSVEELNSAPNSVASNSTAVDEPPSRQMEILCKGGQFTVSVGSRDGGPARTKGKKKPSKKSLAKAAAVVQSKKEPSHWDDPFNYTLSETTYDPAMTLHDFKEKHVQTSGADNCVDQLDKSPSRQLTSDKEADKETDKEADKETDASTSDVEKDEKKGRKIKKAKPKKDAEKVSENGRKQTGRSWRCTSAKIKYTEQQSSDEEFVPNELVKKGKRKNRAARVKENTESNVSSDESLPLLSSARSSRTRQKPKDISLRNGVESELSSDQNVSFESKEPLPISLSGKITQSSRTNQGEDTASSQITEKSRRRRDGKSKTEELEDDERKPVERSTRKQRKRKPTKSESTFEDGGKGSTRKRKTSPADEESNSKIVVSRRSIKSSPSVVTPLHDSDEEMPALVNSRFRRRCIIDSPDLPSACILADLTLTPSAPETAGQPSLRPVDSASNEMVVMETKEKIPEPQVSSPKKSRRAAANINFKEPPLNAKLRRGDPGTSSTYASANSKKGKKKKHDSSN